MKCDACGVQMKSGRENFRYTARGLETVTLMNMEVRRCPECGEYEVDIPRIEELHRLIAQEVTSKAARLTPEEIRFLRKRLGIAGVDFAAVLDVTPETVSRCENGKKPMGPVEVAQGEAIPLRMRLRDSRAHWKAEATAA